MKVDFDDLAPEERRLLLVASEERYAALVRKGARDRLLALGARMLPYAAFAPVATIGAAGVAWAARRLHARVSADLAESPTAGLRDAAAGPAGLGREIEVPHLPPLEAARRFRFDHGLPHDGALYVLDPVAAPRDRYLSAALANERLAQEKVAAFLSLASSLGARRVSIVSAELAATSTRAHVRTPIPDTAAQIGIGARFDAEGRVQRQALMELDRPLAPPSVPEVARPWLAIDPMLRALVDTRLSGEARAVSFALHVHDMIDLDASLAAELEGRGVSLGGGLRRVLGSTWTFSIEWWPAAR